ncbi:hypothetical protein JB92DRAFT_2838430 [Gautieria morchelliformis]|nr:hypothetical protein JB92DRAFT_2838430 [Gautieria morchelliformis]
MHSHNCVHGYLCLCNPPSPLERVGDSPAGWELLTSEVTYSVDWPHPTKPVLGRGEGRPCGDREEVAGDQVVWGRIMANMITPQLYSPMSGKQGEGELPGGHCILRAFFDTLGDWDVVPKCVSESCWPLSLVDLEQQLGVEVREIHDLQKRDMWDRKREMVKGLIMKAVQSGELSLNFLELPNLVAAQRAYLQYSTKWQLLATAPALSQLHINAGKFGTWVQVHWGVKIWVVVDSRPAGYLRGSTSPPSLPHSADRKLAQVSIPLGSLSTAFFRAPYQ